MHERRALIDFPGSAERLMGKLILFLLIGFAVYLVIAAASRKQRRRMQEPVQRPAEKMVACAHCGVNLPRSDAVSSGARFFCSEDHRKLGS